MIYLVFALGVVVGVLVSTDWKIRKLKVEIDKVQAIVSNIDKDGSSAEFYEPETLQEKFKKAEDIDDMLK